MSSSTLTPVTNLPPGDADGPVDPAEAAALAPQTPKDRKARRRKLLTWSVLIGIGVLLIAGQLIKPAFDDGPVEGPKGSSHSTTGNGVAGLAELAAGFGRSVIRYDHPLTDIAPTGSFPIDSDATLVILDATITGDDLNAVDQFVRNGGTLIATVNGPTDWLNEIGELQNYIASYSGAPNFAFGRPADVQAQTVAASGLVDSEPYSLRVLAGSNFGLPPDPTDPDVSPVVRQSEKVTALRITVGQGSVVAFTDASMLSNDLLDQGDNAAFALAILGNASTKVVFAEEPHGYRAATDATGLPENVRWFLGGLLIATLVLMWSRSRRNGPPEFPARELAPPRSRYLTSLASEIDRTTRKRRLSFPKMPRRSRPPVADAATLQTPPEPSQPPTSSTARPEETSTNA